MRGWIASHGPSVLADYLEPVEVTDANVPPDASPPAAYICDIFTIRNFTCNKATKALLVIARVFSTCSGGPEALHSALCQWLPKCACRNHGKVRGESAIADHSPDQQTENVSNPH